jgi:hypothetical protein
MSKKKKRGKAVRKAKDIPKEENEVEADENQYGGLPQRDLKKNLGCG